MLQPPARPQLGRIPLRIHEQRGTFGPNSKLLDYFREFAKNNLQSLRCGLNWGLCRLGRFFGLGQGLNGGVVTTACEGERPPHFDRFALWQM